MLSGKWAGRAWWVPPEPTKNRFQLDGTHLNQLLKDSCRNQSLWLLITTCNRLDLETLGFGSIVLRIKFPRTLDLYLWMKPKQLADAQEAQRLWSLLCHSVSSSPFLQIIKKSKMATIFGVMTPHNSWMLLSVCSWRTFTWRSDH